jgi:hypothetical protein
MSNIYELLDNKTGYINTYLLIFICYCQRTFQTYCIIPPYPSSAGRILSFPYLLETHSLLDMSFSYVMRMHVCSIFVLSKGTENSLIKTRSNKLNNAFVF